MNLTHELFGCAAITNPKLQETMDTETDNRFNRVEYLVEQLQKEIKRVDSRVDGANDWAFKAKTELGKKIDDLDQKLGKLSKDVAAVQKKK